MMNTNNNNNKKIPIIMSDYDAIIFWRERTLLLRTTWWNGMNYYCIRKGNRRLSTVLPARHSASCSFCNLKPCCPCPC